MNNAGVRIRNRRIELGMTQEELALKVGYKSKVSISRLETVRDLPIKKLKPIADALDISVGDLMGWEEEAPPTKENAIMLANIMKSKVMAEYVQKMMNLSEKKKESLFKYIDFLSSTDD